MRTGVPVAPVYLVGKVPARARAIRDAVYSVLLDRGHILCPGRLVDYTSYYGRETYRSYNSWGNDIDDPVVHDLYSSSKVEGDRSP